MSYFSPYSWTIRAMSRLSCAVFPFLYCSLCFSFLNYVVYLTWIRYNEQSVYSHPASASAQSKWLIRHHLDICSQEKSLTVWLAACNTSGVYCLQWKLHLSFTCITRTITVYPSKSLRYIQRKQGSKIHFTWTKSNIVIFLWNWWICFPAYARRKYHNVSLVHLPRYELFVFAKILNKTYWILYWLCLGGAQSQYVQSISFKLLTIL